MVLAAVDHERLAQASSTRSATWTTSTSSLASSMSTADSSPPKRATVSLGRTQDRSRSATWMRRRSPAA
jgi:hypothetical protein